MKRAEAARSQNEELEKQMEGLILEIEKRKVAEFRASVEIKGLTQENQKLTDQYSNLKKSMMRVASGRDVLDNSEVVVPSGATDETVTQQIKDEDHSGRREE